MRNFEMNDWLILNSIIYKIYTTEDFEEMRRTVLEQLKMMLDFDCADFYLSKDDGSDGLESPVLYNCEGMSAEKYDKLDYSRGIMYSGKSMVYKESDIISDEKRRETEYYRRVYIPNGWHYSLQMILGRSKSFLGVVTLYRNIGKDDFTYDDIFLLDMLKDHLAYRLYEERKKRLSGGSRLSVKDAVKLYMLTKREETVLELIAGGSENQKICEDLVISPNTLRKHILNIYRKLNVRNRIQLLNMISDK